MMLSVSGDVQSGNILTKDIVGLQSSVVLYSSGLTGSTVLASGVTDASGNFTLNYSLTEKPALMYIVAQPVNKLVFGKKFVKLIHVLTRGSRFYTINELSTVTVSWAFVQFYDVASGSIYGPPRALATCAGMAYNIVTWGGDPAVMIMDNPNDNETNTFKIVNTLCNLLCLVIRNVSKYLSLTGATSSKIKDTLDALHHIARNPTAKIHELFALAKQCSVYYNALVSAAPAAYTLALKVNKTGNNNYMFGGPGNLVFDDDGKVWITNNVFQGGAISSNFAVVLEPNGLPASISPVFGSGLYGAGFGICKDVSGSILIGNFGWGGANPVEGSVTKFDAAGRVLSPNCGQEGYVRDLDRVQGMCVDKFNNLWLASYGNDRIVVYIGGLESNSVYLQLPKGSEPFGLACDSNGGAVYTCRGLGGSVGKARLDPVLKKVSVVFSYDGAGPFVGVAVDSLDNIYACAFTKDAVYKLDCNGSLIGLLKNGGVCNPWGCYVDSGDNVLVANFGRVGVTPYGISYFDKTGKAISPDPSGFVVESGGSVVRLPNGRPLYTDCHIPMMKQTGINVDCAGNVWVCNNWKPYYALDTTNPGGDGLIIFLGLAKPAT
jgi:DNA-binding beta-propeller fold protein YncE